MTSKPVTIYISKSLKYPSESFKEIERYLKSMGFIVTYYVKGEKYSSKKLLDADIVFCLVKKGLTISYPDDGFGPIRGIHAVGKGQHDEIQLAMREGKVVVSNIGFEWNSLPDFKRAKDVYFIRSIRMLLVDDIKIQDINDWKKNYGTVHAYGYCSEGADFYEFVTGNLMVESNIKHSPAVLVSKKYLGLLLIQN